MKYLRYLFPLLWVVLYSSCQEEVKAVKEPGDHTRILIDISELELALFNKNDDQAIYVLGKLDEKLADSYTMFCYYECLEIDGARMTTNVIKQQIGRVDKHHLLKDLRLLKNQVMHLNLEGDFDPYLFIVWRLEEALNEVYITAIDEMLNLYEYNEFESQVACLEESLVAMKSHHPGPELLGFNDQKIKDHTQKKLMLTNAIQQFIQATRSERADGLEIEKKAERMHQAYYNYIAVFAEAYITNESIL